MCTQSQQIVSSVWPQLEMQNQQEYSQMAVMKLVMEKKNCKMRHIHTQRDAQPRRISES